MADLCYLKIGCKYGKVHYIFPVQMVFSFRPVVIAPTDRAFYDMGPTKTGGLGYIWVDSPTLKIAPVGLAVMISTKPLCAWANFFTSARPRPVPVVSRVASGPMR